MPVDPASRLLGQYARQAGVADELFDANGVMRGVWAPFVSQLAGLADSDIEDRFKRGENYLRDAGVFFRQYTRDAQQERDWPLSPIPVILHEQEWARITAGLGERADLLERVVADLYGPQQLIRDGHLPAELIAENPQWLRPLMGVAPASGHYLHLIAFEIGRGPDGSWFVLGDRTQAPSGSGFALENRMATSRIFSGFEMRSRVHRLAGFFREFRAAMGASAESGGGRTAILTPGPGTDTYYEHAYIARYLGLMLLEGEDLVVHDDRVLVRTIAGLEPVSVLWRRMDAGFADPLELDERSQIGTPGLLGALRAGQLSMVNALGAGILETRAFLAFLPRIARVLMGRDLAMPNIATWWCGQDAERKFVLENASRMLVAAALSTDLPFDLSGEAAVAGELRGPYAGTLADWVAAQGPKLVGQEAVTLSTTPAYHDGQLMARPMTARVFAARTPEGWKFMPGGYARIGNSSDPTALSMQRGGAVADVWIVSDAEVPAETLVPHGASFTRSTRGVLPSRAGDNLYWLGRYVERTETAIRLMRAYHLRIAESGNPADPRVTLLAGYLDHVGIDMAEPMPMAAVHLLDSAITCAGKLRDRLSPDGWNALHDMARTMRSMTATVKVGDDGARAMGVLLRKITGFAGLIHENMYRFSGWRFLSLGRALERADALCSMLARLLDPAAPEGSLDIAVELADSVLTHRRRYSVETSALSVADLLVLDSNNPRAILFQLDLIREQVAALPGSAADGRLSELSRAVLGLQTELMVAHAEDMTIARLQGVRDGILAISNLLTSTYLR